MKTCLSIVASLLVLSLSAQLEDAIWHFGAEIQLDSSTDPAVSSSYPMTVDAGVIPASICNATGEHLLSCNGEEVRGPLDVLPDGLFPESSVENLFIPVPDNPDQYFLVRSTLDGLDYSRIDLTLGLEGDIIEGEKTIDFHNQNSRLLSTAKPFGSDHWLLALDNASAPGQVVIDVFSVTADGIVEESTYGFDYLWIDWFAVLDDVDLSPNCDQIAITFKGHYVALLSFDHETGMVTDPLGMPFNTGDSFSATSEIVFSPNGQYVYTTGNGSNIQQFDVSSTSITTIESSGISISAGGSSGPLNWLDMKRAPNGKIYVQDSSGDKIDVINFPDLPGEDTDFEINAVSPDANLTGYFPRTPYLACAPVAPFVQVDVIQVCLGDPTEFSLSTNVVPDLITWEFGDSSGSTSNLEDPVFLYDEVGQYNVTVDVVYDEDSLISEEVIVEIYPYSQPDLGADIEVCEGTQVILDAGVSAGNYSWNTGDSGETLEVFSSGTYWVSAANGPCALSDSIDVIINPLPVVVCSEDIVYCDEMETTVLSMSSNVDAVWNNGSTANEITVGVPGTYSATGSNQCGTASDEVTVSVVTMPQDFLPDDIQACTGDTVNVFTTAEAENYAWDTGGNSPGIIVTEDGTYTLVLSIGECTSVDAVDVTYLDEISLDHLIMPNVFSVNADIYNPTFRPFDPAQPEVNPCGSTGLEVSTDVYNRWGNLVAEGVCNWDGTSTNSGELLEGVYYYITTLRSVCGSREKERVIQGDLHLMR